MPHRREIVVRPNLRWLHFDWRAIVEYRDLLYMLVWRDFAVKYKQTALGPMWFLISPVITTLVFTVIFGHVVQIPTNGLPPVLFYLCGLLGWNYFAQTLQHAASTFVSHAEIFDKVYFPRLILPLAAGISNIFAFLVQLITFAGFWVYFKYATDMGERLPLEPNVLLFPLLLAHTAALALGVGLWIAAATAKYRDLMHVLGLVVQLWMYATPVIYPMSAAPVAYRWILMLNPMAPIIEGFRYVFLGEGFVTPAVYGGSVAVSLIVLISGVIVFQRVEQTFIDTI